MTKERRDKLGRKIPEFDRTAAIKKGNATKKAKDNDFHTKFAAAGGRSRTRGYFGHLKDEGKESELRELSTKALAAKKAKKTNSGTPADARDGH